MAMVPVCPALTCDVEAVGKGVAGRNGAIGRADCAVHVVRAVLVQSVPMYGSRVGSSVVHVNNDLVMLVDLDQWTREGGIDKHHGSVHAVWIKLVVFDDPAVLSGGWRRLELPTWVQYIVVFWSQSRLC